MMRRATCNARKELGPAQAAGLIGRVASMADVIGWQEIETDDHRRAVDALPHHDTYWPAGRYRLGKRKGQPKVHPANAVPITWDARKYRLWLGSKKRLHGGVRYLTPARYLTWVVLVDLEDERAECHENTHWIQQAFTSKPGNRSMWDRGAQVTARIVARHVKRWGFVVGGGDLNRNHHTIPGTRPSYALHGTHGNAYYDQVWTAGTAVSVGLPQRVETNSDHDALILHVERKP